MERRVAERKNGLGDVTVYLQVGTVRRRCELGNLSAKGAFVKTYPQSCYTGRTVELTFAQPAGPVVEMRRLRAKVVHMSQAGIGVVLLGCPVLGQQLRRRLREQA